MPSPDCEWPRWWRIVALSSTILAVEFAYAVEAGYGIPMLLKTGLEERYASLMWSASPVLGIFFQGYMGSASDECTCSWGRRRPFIFVLGIVILLALALFPYGASIARLLAGLKHVVIPYTTILFVSMDFSLDAIQSPSRLFLLDSVSEERTQRGNLIYSTMMGLGATLGGIVAAIPWKKLGGELGDNFETQTKLVFGFTVMLFGVCTVLTMRSVSESQTRKLKNSHLPLDDKPQKKSSCKFISDIPNDFCSSLQQSFSFAKDMSLTFFSLWVLTFFGYFTFNGFYLFLTEYVGSVIYDGVADSDDKVLRDRYDEGVLAGCACIVLCNMTLFLSSLLINWVLDYMKVSLKYLTLYTFLAYLIALGLALLVPSLLTTFFAALICGLFSAVIVTVPFTLVAQNERSGVLMRTKKQQSAESLLGKAVSFLFIAVFAAQFVLGICQGSLIHYFGTSRVIIVTVFVAQLFATGFLVFNLEKFSDQES